MKEAQSNLALTIMSSAFKHERAMYNELMKKKALQLKKLEARDIEAIPDSEARKINWLIEQLTEELTAMYGFKRYTDQMEIAYNDSIVQILNWYYYPYQDMERELSILRQSNDFWEYMHTTTLESLSLMSDIAIEKSKRVTN